MKRIFLVLTAFSLVAVMSALHAQSPTQKLAQTWLDLLNRHDTLALAGMYANDAILLSHNWEAAKIGQAEARTVYSRYFKGTPDLSYRLTHLIATDSAIVIEYSSSGTFLNPEQGTPAYMKGKAYTLQNCTRLDIHNGRITRQVNYFDQVAFLRQVGFFDQH